MALCIHRIPTRYLCPDCEATKRGLAALTGGSNGSGDHRLGVRRDGLQGTGRGHGRGVRGDRNQRAEA